MTTMPVPRRPARPRAVLALVSAAAVTLALLPAASVSAQTSGYPVRSSVAGTPDPTPAVVLRGRGWGHSVGLSQYGAYAQARAGRTANTILQHYYPGVTSHTWTGDQTVRVNLYTGGLSGSNLQAVGGPVTWRRTSPGGDTQDLVQPSGTTWRIDAAGSSNPSRIVFRDGSGQTLYAGNGTVEARLSSPSVFREARGRVAMANPNGGSRQYAYGRILIEAVSGGLHVTNRLPLEGYVRGIAEVPSGWGNSGGQAALVAQAIIARTYVLSRNRVTCATPACQVFGGYSKELDFAGDRWVAAVTGSDGRFLRAPDGSVAQTFYSSSHGGRTEASEDSWAYGGAVPYLRSVDDPWSLDPNVGNSMRSWTLTASNSAFRRVAGAGLSRVERVQIMSRTDGGSPRVLRVHGPEGVNEFTHTPTGVRTSRACNRGSASRPYAGNSLRCDLAGTVRNINGDIFAGAGGFPASSQIRSIGFDPFVDDDGNAHEYAITWTHQAGIANGVSATRFAPRDAVTRGQMATFIYKTFQIPRRTSSSFPDAQSGPHAEAIASITAAGIASGKPDGTFGTHDPVTRGQMATFLVKALGLSPRDPNQFDDVATGSTHGRSIGALAHSGITSGCAVRRFCPNHHVQRAQMATFLHTAVRSR